MKRVIIFLSVFCLLGATQAFSEEPPAASDAPAAPAAPSIAAEKNPVARKMQSRKYKGDLPLANPEQDSSASDEAALEDAPKRAERAPESKSAASRYEETKDPSENAIWDKYKALVGSVKPQESTENAAQAPKTLSAAEKLRAQSSGSLSDEQQSKTPSAKNKEEPTKAAQAPSGNPITDILRQYKDRTQSAPRMGVRSFGGEKAEKKEETPDSENEDDNKDNVEKDGK